MNWFKRKSSLEGTTADLYLIVGLGNPGREYAETRHNVGFMVIDACAKQAGISLSRVKSKAIIGQGQLGEKKVIFAKPQTYMNLSGQAVGGLARFFKISHENILVVHDDMDIPLGTLRIRKDGGPGGQKGIKSIIEHLGTTEFPRIRFGIGRPPGRMDPKAYVLERFLPREKEDFDFTLMRARDAVLTFVNDGIDRTMNNYNGDGK
ncbi:MAG: aminoacyl-tRNA hydrolase [Anaerolineae bacterium]|jgi:PTH1 family peptidyl-tRNA hydrolase|nr:aminoacyl-tRNA hydrolase [Anaerolineae bacterium]